MIAPKYQTPYNEQHKATLTQNSIQQPTTTTTKKERANKNSILFVSKIHTTFSTMKVTNV